MHAVSHSLAHRGPGASRTRTRWQPYSSNTLNSTPPLVRSPQTYLHTPPSSVLSSTPSTSYISPVQQIERNRPTHPPPVARQQINTCGTARPQTRKYSDGLVDQAVKSLCDSWQPEDIPTVFCAKSQPAPADASTHLNAVPSEVPIHRNNQLPSPISPFSQSSPISNSPVTSTAQGAASTARPNQLLPIRGFVHEVLRRSRTTTGVLQTALCYLEAVRHKVPDLIAQEKARPFDSDTASEQVAEERIILAEDLDACEDYEVAASQSAISDVMDTVRDCEDRLRAPLTAPPTEPLTCIDNEHAAPNPPASKSPKSPYPPLPPLPPSPSPLLCPRRTFLACLILASKFMQDRSYSNRAWAKLAGLPPREIGRCERAVGEALNWRLWVGKCPAAAASVPASVAIPHKAVARCRSDATLQLATCGWQGSAAPAAGHTQRTCASLFSSSGLRRSATMPTLGSEAPSTINTQLAADQWPTSTATPAFAYTVTSEPPLDTGFLTRNTTPYGADFMDYSGGLHELSVFNRYMASSPYTPPLSYSPMSTSSTASSDDGDRPVHLTSVSESSHSHSGPMDAASACGGFGSRYVPSAPPSGVKLAGFGPIAMRDSVRLPPLSEAIFNPVLMERSIGPIPGFNGIRVGDSVSEELHHNFSNWSMSN